MSQVRYPTVASDRQGPLWRDPFVVGTLCGLLSAVGYTAANICLRQVALDHDPIWVSCVKAVPTVVLVGPWLLARAWRSLPVLPGAAALGRLVLAALIGQLLGNVMFQWALGVVGIALTVPLTLGSLILAGAVLGRMWLGEAITLRTAVSIVVLILAILVLCQGADQAHRSLGAPAGEGLSVWWLIAAGVGAACLSGVAYAVLSVVIRHGVTGAVPMSTSLVTVTLVGTVTLGGWSLARLGLDGLLATPLADLNVMLLAGVLNAIAFVCLTKSLQTVTVVYVNALSATQATMSAIAGVVLFGEALSGAMALGVMLTIVGLMLMRRGRSWRRGQAAAWWRRIRGLPAPDAPPVAAPTED